VKLWSVIALAILPVAGWSSNVTNYFDPIASSGTAQSVSGTINNGASGNNAYYSGTSTISADSSITDNGSGLLTLVGVSASGVISASNIGVGNGTTASPSIYFQNSASSGWYRAGNNQLNMTLNGNVVDRFATSSRGIMTALNAASATFHVGTSCSGSTCAGSGMFAGPLVVNLGSGGASASIAGLQVSGSIQVSNTGSVASCTTQIAGAIRYISTTNTLGLCTNGASGFAWYQMSSTTTTVTTTTP
jgi:hypothetical protein